MRILASATLLSNFRDNVVDESPIESLKLLLRQSCIYFNFSVFVYSFVYSCVCLERGSYLSNLYAPALKIKKGTHVVIGKSKFIQIYQLHLRYCKSSQYVHTTQGLQYWLFVQPLCTCIGTHVVIGKSKFIQIYQLHLRYCKSSQYVHTTQGLQY